MFQYTPFRHCFQNFYVSVVVAIFPDTLHLKDTNIVTHSLMRKVKSYLGMYRKPSESDLQQLERQHVWAGCRFRKPPHICLVLIKLVFRSVPSWTSKPNSILPLKYGLECLHIVIKLTKLLVGADLEATMNRLPVLYQIETFHL